MSRLTGWLLRARWLFSLNALKPVFLAFWKSFLKPLGPFDCRFSGLLIALIFTLFTKWSKLWIYSGLFSELKSSESISIDLLFSSSLKSREGLTLARYRNSSGSFKGHILGLLISSTLTIFYMNASSISLAYSSIACWVFSASLLLKLIESYSSMIEPSLKLAGLCLFLFTIDTEHACFKQWARSSVLILAEIILFVLSNEFRLC